MSTETNTVTAGGDTLSGRPARPADSERREHSANSMLPLEPGAGPTQSREDCMASQCPPARPVRFDDPARNAAYWARVDAIAASAPPLSPEQRAVIRTAFSTVTTSTQEAA